MLVRTNSHWYVYVCSGTTVKHQSEDGLCNKQSQPACKKHSLEVKELKPITKLKTIGP